MLYTCIASCLHDISSNQHDKENPVANTNVTIRIDEGLKKEADSLFDDLGMSFTTAVNVFVKQAVREGRIPFEISKTPRQHGCEYAVTSLSEASENER